ncbi:hypothetical protein E2C01_021034 [Portunus trituberculatus]|uniref:Uncharacterized protein n=1 Tax=Portunus trituberculatus TaxID=210409 RepID=A0A5B7E264_PORTR|nr:hypothetical protein [Portunus trituberculatus]
MRGRLGKMRVRCSLTRAFNTFKDCSCTCETTSFHHFLLLRLPPHQAPPPPWRVAATQLEVQWQLVSGSEAAGPVAPLLVA